MKRHFLLGILLAGLAMKGFSQTTPLYQNFGVVTSPLQIDATTFVNGGLFDLSGGGGSIIIISGGAVSYGNPFDTQNTVYYTNLASGLMNYTAGFNFYFLTNGFPYPAGVFVNRGEIDGYLLKISATNVNSSGIISANGGGLLKMDGQKVDLTRAGLDASAIGGINNNAGTTLYLGIGTNTSLGIFNGRGRGIPLSTFDLPAPASPTHQVMQKIGGSYITNNVLVPVLNTSGYTAFANTNLIDPTNLLVQVIFVSTNSFKHPTDTNKMVNVNAGFLAPPRGYQADYPGSFSVVEWSYPDYDIVRGNPFTNFFYLVDTAATQTNFAYTTNQTTLDYLSPDNFTLSQATNQSFYLGLNNPNGTITTVNASKLTANTSYTNTLIADPNYAATRTVTNFYASYAAAVGPSAASAVILGGGINPALSDPTNLPGRVEITANQLDLSKLRVRADNLFSISTPNLLSATNMQMNAALLSFDVGTTNGSLIISNMIPVRVDRLNGTILAWTGLWTNSLDVANTNATPPTTNTIAVITHVLIVDHAITGQQTVQSYNMTLHSTNVVINDDLNLTKTFMVDAETLANNANLYGSALNSLDLSTFPRLTHFTNGFRTYLTNSGVVTNFASISVSSGTLSAILSQPAASIVNYGSMSASGIKLGANTIINSGVINSGGGILGSSAGSIFISADNAALVDGQLLAANDIHLSGNDFTVRNSKLTGSTIYLNVTNRLSDSWAEIVYDNTATNLNNLYSTTNEFGVMVTLGGSSQHRFVTNFTTLYYINPTNILFGNENVRLKFYDTSGPANSPGKVLYDSGSLSVKTGYNPLTVYPNVLVTNSFIWTVQFNNLTNGGTGSLVINASPKVGAGGTNFWGKISGVWKLSSGGYPGSFYAQIFAGPPNGTWLCTAGFQLQSKPATGDLLYTTVISSNTVFAQTQHLWAGQDRGANASGFTNNMAIGKLILKGARDSQFAFTGSGASNALYVDYLQLENYATNYLDSIVIDTNMVIYFANANLPPLTLNSQFNGRLRWVPNFAGPNSSTNVTLANGVMTNINVVFYNLDSNGNGISDAFDPDPFNFKITKLAVSVVAPQKALISWTSAAQSVYRIDYTTDLLQPTWQLLTYYTNSTPANRAITLTDPIPAGFSQRFYRISYPQPY